MLLKNRYFFRMPEENIAVKRTSEKLNVFFPFLQMRKRLEYMGTVSPVFS